MVIVCIGISFLIIFITLGWLILLEGNRVIKNIDDIIGDLRKMKNGPF